MPGQTTQRFEALQIHEFEAALRGMEEMKREREAWQVNCRYLRDGQGLVAGERIRVVPAGETEQAVLELDTLRNLVLLPDGSVRQTTAGQAWEISERAMELM